MPLWICCAYQGAKYGRNRFYAALNDVADNGSNEGAWVASVYGAVRIFAAKSQRPSYPLPARSFARPSALCRADAFAGNVRLKELSRNC